MPESSIPSKSAVKLLYNFKHCPCCGSILSDSILVSTDLDEPEFGFAGDFSTSFEYSDDVTCVRLLCDSCYEQAQIFNAETQGRLCASESQHALFAPACTQ